MDGRSIAVREARPVYEEGLAAARYTDMASEGGIRKALGGRHDEIIATAFTEPDHDLSFQNTVFAEHDDRIVGMASGYTAREHSRSTDLPLRKAPGSRLRRVMGLVILRFVFGIMGHHREGDFYIAFVGVDGDLRGEGVGSRLLFAMEERARTRGAKRLTLDVSARNEGAKRLYERLGMKVDYSWPRLRILPDVIYHMAKEL